MLASDAAQRSRRVVPTTSICKVGACRSSDRAPPFEEERGDMLFVPE
jgi:hypothetical protein